MLKDTIQAAVIQNWLDQQPKIPLRTEPLFRLVWSDDQREKRIGTFRVYTGNIFIREETKVENCEKYSFIKERWILEQWFPPEVAMNDELPDSKNGSYEPIYVFDRESQALPLNLQVVQFIVHTCLKPKKSGQFKKSLFVANKEAQERKAFSADLDTLQDEGPLVSQFHDGSAILNATAFKEKAQ